MDIFPEITLRLDYFSFVEVGDDKSPTIQANKLVSLASTKALAFFIQVNWVHGGNTSIQNVIAFSL